MDTQLEFVKLVALEKWLMHVMRWDGVANYHSWMLAGEEPDARWRFVAQEKQKTRKAAVVWVGFMFFFSPIQ